VTRPGRILHQEAEQLVLHECQVQRISGEAGLIVQRVQLEILEFHQVVDGFGDREPLETKTQLKGVNRCHQEV